MFDLPTTIAKLRELAECLMHPKLRCAEESQFLHGVADLLAELPQENLLAAAEKALAANTEHHCIYCSAFTVTPNSLCNHCRHELGHF